MLSASWRNVQESSSHAVGLKVCLKHLQLKRMEFTLIVSRLRRGSRRLQGKRIVANLQWHAHRIHTNVCTPVLVWQSDHEWRPRSKKTARIMSQLIYGNLSSSHAVFHRTYVRTNNAIILSTFEQKKWLLCHSLLWQKASDSCWNSECMHNVRTYRRISYSIYFLSTREKSIDSKCPFEIRPWQFFYFGALNRIFKHRDVRDNLFDHFTTARGLFLCFRALLTSLTSSKHWRGSWLSWTEMPNSLCWQ